MGPLGGLQRFVTLRRGKKNKASWDAGSKTVLITPQDPYSPHEHSVELEVSSHNLGSPKEFDQSHRAQRIAQQTTGNSVASSSNGKPLPSPPPPYHDTTFNPYSTVSATPRPPHIGQCHIAADKALMNQASRSTHQQSNSSVRMHELPVRTTTLETMVPSAEPGDQNVPELGSSNSTHQEICVDSTEKCVRFDVRWADSIAKRRPPPIRTDIPNGLDIALSRTQDVRAADKAASKSICTSPVTRCIPDYVQPYLTSPTSTISSRSAHSTCRDSATILQTNGQIWIFPNITTEQVIARIQYTGVQIDELTDEGGGSQDSRTRSQQSSSDSSPISNSSKTGTGQGNKRRINDGGDRRKAKIARRQQAEGDDTKKIDQPKYACPFSAHSPDRYITVHNSCTSPPGLAFKYLVEHIKRVHSAVTHCIYCLRVWSTPNWEQELRDHLPDCPLRLNISSKPECMNASQESIYKEAASGPLDPDTRWVLLYMKLWPESFPIPNPRYNYYTASHRIVTPPRSNSSSPVGNQDAQTHGTVWFVYSHPNSQMSYASPQSSPQSDMYGAFSAPGSFPLGNQTVFPTHASVRLQPSLNSAGDAWAPQPVYGQPEGIPGLVDTTFADIATGLVMPQNGDDGNAHLNKWIGQSTPYQVDVLGLFATLEGDPQGFHNS